MNDILNLATNELSDQNLSEVFTSLQMTFDMSNPGYGNPQAVSSKEYIIHEFCWNNLLMELLEAPTVYKAFASPVTSLAKLLVASFQSVK